jgi:hypothetical protein
VEGPPTVHAGLPGATGLPCTLRLAPERWGRPDPSATNGCRPRCHHQQGAGDDER